MPAPFFSHLGSSALPSIPLFFPCHTPLVPLLSGTPGSYTSILVCFFPRSPCHLFSLSQLHVAQTGQGFNSSVLSPPTLPELTHQCGLRSYGARALLLRCCPSPPWRSRFPLTSLFLPPAFSADSYSLFASPSAILYASFRSRSVSRPHIQ